MRGGMPLSPLQIIPEGIVKQPHVEMAELGLRFQYHEIADRLAFVGGHGLVAVLIALLGKPPHLGGNLGVGYLKVKVADPRLDSLQFGQIVKGTI